MIIGTGNYLASLDTYRNNYDVGTRKKSLLGYLFWEKKFFGTNILRKNWFDILRLVEKLDKMSSREKRWGKCPVISLNGHFDFLTIQCQAQLFYPMLQGIKIQLWNPSQTGASSCKIHRPHLFSKIFGLVFRTNLSTTF